MRVFDAGLTFSVTLARRFQITRWVSHPRETVDAVKLDRDLMWKTTPETTYGVDLAMQFTNLNVHIGGLLGYLVNTSSESGRVMDKS